MINWKRAKEELGATLWYSLVSHCRGHLHMSRISGSTAVDILGSMPAWRWMREAPPAEPRGKGKNGYPRQVFSWTMEDQEKLVAPLIEKYTEDNLARVA